jgi:iron complex outermembrane receptor protein
MKLRTLGAVSSLAVAVGMAAPAYAQNREIVVTAEFTEASLQDTPIAITAVDAELLEVRGQTGIEDVAAQAPNVSLRPQPQNGGSGLIAFIRGVGQVDFNYALDPGVGVYIDDVFIPTLSSSLLELMDLERIEILRGPQGTLAGKNSIGGSIKLFSQKPQGDGTGSMRVEYGSYNLVSLRGMADFALTDDVSMRISGMGRSRDGYVAMLDYGATHPGSNVPGSGRGYINNRDYEAMGGENLIAGRAALRYQGSNLEINISADYTREDSQAGPTVLLAAGQPTPAGVSSELFDPFSSNPSLSTASDFSTIPWLMGTDGMPVELNCQFVPSGPYSCDSANVGGMIAGYDARFVSYSDFLDSMEGNPQAPFKPYFALPITEFEGWGVQGNITLDLNDNLQLVYIGSYRTYDSKWGQDQDATPIPIAQLDNHLHHSAWSSELRLNFSTDDDMVSGTVGGFYLDQEGDYEARVDLNYVNPTIDFIHGPDTTPSTSKALFATVTVRPIDALGITGGIRYTDDEKTYTYYRSNPDGTIPDGFNCFVANGVFSEPNCILSGLFGVPGLFEGDRWDWRIVGDVRLSDQLLAYASVSTGFKGGGVNPRPFVGDQALPFNPETATTYEIGFKADLADNLVRLNGAAFLNKYNDIILGKQICPESSLPSPCLRPENIGSADVKGFELEASIFPVDGLSIDGSLAVLDFEYTTAVDGNGNLVGTGINGNNITPYTPELTYSIGVQYDHELQSGSVISARFDGSFQDDVYTNAENTSWALVDGRFLGNARLSFSPPDGDWKIAVEVQNLFDNYYFLSKSDVASNSLGLVTGVPGMPRTFSVQIQKDF